MRINTVSILALLCASTVSAVAQDSDVNWYAGLRGSLAFDGAIKANAATVPPTAAKLNMDVGGGASVFWGIHLPSDFKVELEMLYRYQPLADATINGTSAKLGGYAEMFAPMVNAYWTAPVDFPIQPIIGGGLGYAWNEIGVNQLGSVTFPTTHDDNWRFAYNAMAGFNMPINENSRVTVMYRWLHEDIAVNCGTSLACSGSLNNSSIDIGLEMDL
jgi:opacity protein-like surface antigen